MIYLDLSLSFLYVGFFSFGGAYGAIPLIRDVVLSHEWLTDETLTYIIAISESTPGPIMINLATYIGSVRAGFWGAVLATVAVVLPSFFIILFLTAVLKTAIKNKYVQATLQGLKPCIMGIIFATGAYMAIGNCISFAQGISVNVRAVIITVILIMAMYGAKLVRKQKISPIMLIVISACLGAVVFWK